MDNFATFMLQQLEHHKNPEPLAANTKSGPKTAVGVDTQFGILEGLGRIGVGGAKAIAIEMNIPLRLVSHHMTELLADGLIAIAGKHKRHSRTYKLADAKQESNKPVVQREGNVTRVSWN